MSKPPGKLKFAYETIADLEQQLATLTRLAQAAVDSDGYEALEIYTLKGYLDSMGGDTD